MIGPLFSTKSIWMARFFWVPMWKAPFFWHPGICIYFFAQRFFKAAYPLRIIWIDCDICVITSKKWVQKIKGQYMNRSTFWMIKYMNGSVFFSKAMYMNGVGFEIQARTPVPKLPLSYNPQPPSPTRFCHEVAKFLMIIKGMNKCVFCSFSWDEFCKFKCLYAHVNY